MALLWCDGFEGYGVGVDHDFLPAGVIADKYDGVLNEDRWYLRTGLHDVACIQIADSGYKCRMQPRVTTANNTLIQGCYFYVYQIDGWREPYWWPLFRFEDEDGNMNVQLMVCQGTFWISGPSRKYYGGTRANVELQGWNHLEMKVVSSNSAGTIELRLNGAPVYQASSMNTQEAGGKPAELAQIGHDIRTYDNEYCRIDDWYICDGSGGNNDDFLGPVEIQTLWPASDNQTQFSSTGNANYTTHYEQVFSHERLGTSDYVQDATTNNQDTFGLDAADTFNDVHGCIVWGAINYQTSSTNYSFTLTSGGSTDTSATGTAPASVATRPFVVENDPSTNSAFTNAALDSIICGMKVEA